MAHTETEIEIDDVDIEMVAAEAGLDWKAGEPKPLVTLFAWLYTKHREPPHMQTSVGADIGKAAGFIKRKRLDGLRCHLLTFLRLDAKQQNNIQGQWRAQLDQHGYPGIDTTKLWLFVNGVATCLESNPPDEEVFKKYLRHRTQHRLPILPKVQAA